MFVEFFEDLVSPSVVRYILCNSLITIVFKIIDFKNVRANYDHVFPMCILKTVSTGPEII